MKTSELTGAALDWAVAKCEGHDAHFYNGVVRTTMRGVFGSECSYSTDWAQGGAIIEREGITLVCAQGEYSAKLRGAETYWVAEKGHQCANEVYGPQGDDWGTCFQIEDHLAGKTPLEAAMRCYVASKLGDEVEIPEELK
jgi:hypothetical protein